MDLFTPAPSLAGDDDGVDIASYSERAYLEYALSVVKGRALPDVSDGQKPVQRRILYAMARMGLGFTTGAGPRAVKSARVVGRRARALPSARRPGRLRRAGPDGAGLLAALSPDRRPGQLRLARRRRRRGDALHRGPAGADHAPAPRRDRRGSVDFIPNYDGSTIEPKTLPARLPFVLLNGASGIAVGLATEVPSHNLREIAAAAVALIRDDKLGDDALAALIPGPDYAGGGQIISSAEEIRAAYASGRGSLKVRARWKIEDLARGQWQLVVTELPPWHQHAEGAGGGRGADQPEGQGRQEDLGCRADAAEGADARLARRSPRRVEQGGGGAAGLRAEDADHRPAESAPCCSRTPAWRARPPST
jgi:topoisomerase-4 subunit A